MAAINQRIRNFLGGVSQQPDFIKFPGQLRTCHNAFPDVTFGLQKRPPGEYVGKLTNAKEGGEWFEILRDNDERYITQIVTYPAWEASTKYKVGDRVLNDSAKVYVCDTAGTSAGSGGPTGTGANITDGTTRWDHDASLTSNYSSNRVRVWDLQDGTEKTVNFTGGASTNFNYLTKSGTQPYGKLTLNDYTIIANPEKVVGKARSTATFQDNYAFVTLNEIAYNTEYVIALGNTNLQSTTKYKINGLKVVKQGTSSPTWETASPDAAYTGVTEYYNESAGDAWDEVKFTVVVNATHFVNSYDGNNPNYNTQYTATVTLQESGFNVGTNWASISNDVSVNGQNWTVSITGVSSYQSYADSNAAIYRTPKNVRKGEITKDTVLGNLKAAIEAKYTGSGGTVDATVTVAGNGLFISTNAAFGSIGVRGGLTGNSLEAFTDTVQNISKLPGTCRDGYIVKVANTEDADADDYYVKFITGGSGTGDVGVGVWEETIKPGIDAGFNYDSMPHALINNRDGTFTWSSLAYADSNNDGTNDYTGPDEQYWVDRVVGDDSSNPYPTFLGRKITSLFFVRNRLGMLAGEQVVLSQAADYFNFFVGSAIGSSDGDPIDMGASDVKPAILNYALPIQNGVIMFSEAAQFMLYTESESFSPSTAQLKKLSGYEATGDYGPVDLGTTVMFGSNASSFSKVYELSLQGGNVPPDIIEQTRVVPEYIPRDINRMTNSAQAGVVTLGKLGGSDLYHYKYFGQGQQRQQSAWYSWGLKGTLVHQLYSLGDFYTVTKQGSDYVLLRYELVVNANDTRAYSIGPGTVGSPTTISRRFESCLDNMVVHTANAGTGTTPGVSVAYSGGVGGNTTVTLPYTIVGSASDIQLVELADGNVRTPNSISGATATFNSCDLRTIKFACGYTYTTEIGLPTYYKSGNERGKYDVNADLRIHRLNFNLGVSGPLEFHITSPQRDTYIHEESGIISDISAASVVPSQLYKDISVPIYNKNIKHDVTIKIPDPFTATIVSASWDGSYHTRRHARQ